MNNIVDIDKVSSIGKVTAEILKLESEISSLQSASTFIMDDNVSVNGFRIVVNGNYQNRPNVETTAHLDNNAHISDALLDAINTQISLLTAKLEAKVKLLSVYTADLNK
jgi:hypothetical protein